jgi:hypothetical protein
LRFSVRLFCAFSVLACTCFFCNEVELDKFPQSTISVFSFVLPTFLLFFCFLCVFLYNFRAFFLCIFVRFSVRFSLCFSCVFQVFFFFCFLCILLFFQSVRMTIGQHWGIRLKSYIYPHFSAVINGKKRKYQHENTPLLRIKNPFQFEIPFSSFFSFFLLRLIYAN